VGQRTALWFATIVTRVEIRFREAVIVVVAASAARLVPTFAGTLLALVVFLLLLGRFTAAPVWPDLVLTSVVSVLFSLLITLGIGSWFAQVAGA